MKVKGLHYSLDEIGLKDVRFKSNQRKVSKALMIRNSKIKKSKSFFKIVNK